MNKEEYYYDVVASIYEASEDGMDCRVDSHLLCGGFNSLEDATGYIDTNDCTEYGEVGNTKYTSVEIERHRTDGSIAGVITVDQEENS